MSRRALLIGAAVAAVAAPSLVSWLRPAPVAAAVAPRSATAPRTEQMIARAFGVVPVVRAKYCAEREYTVAKVAGVYVTTAGPCTTWGSP